MLNANLIQINSDKENNYVQSLLIKKDKISKNLIVTKDTKISLSLAIRKFKNFIMVENKITKQFFAGVTY